MKFYCKHCRTTFQPTPDELDLFETGEIDAPDLCQECYEMSEIYLPFWDEEFVLSLNDLS